MRIRNSGWKEFGSGINIPDLQNSELDKVIEGNHRLNMELDTMFIWAPYEQHSYTHWLRPATPSPPPIWAHIRRRYWSAKIDDSLCNPPAANKEIITIGSRDKLQYLARKVAKYSVLWFSVRNCIKIFLTFLPNCETSTIKEVPTSVPVFGRLVHYLQIRICDFVTCHKKF
jgi:hypothetical protein